MSGPCVCCGHWTINKARCHKHCPDYKKKEFDENAA